MKKLALIIPLIFAVLLLCNDTATIEKINKYSGKNAKGLLELYSQNENGEYIKFILDNSSPNDLAVLTPEYIKKNIELALKTKEFQYSKLYDENIFRHFVLPLRITQEPFEDWRERFYKELSPIVKDVSDIEEAAILVNIWTEEQMTYKPTHGKDQAPLTTIKRGYGRCEEMMIIYMAAARSVGVPVRSAGAPLWSFTDSNHAWVEVWTPTGWKYLGAGESSDQLNKTWFTKTTERASIITSMAFGLYNGEDVIEQKNNSTEISTIKYYTDKWDKCTINIDDENGQPVENAKVIFYAVSWGGILPMQELQSDKNGQVNIPLGKGAIFMSAYEKEKGFGYSMFDTLEGTKDIRIEIKKNNKIKNTDLIFKFQIVSNDNDQKKELKKYFEGKFDLMKERASLKRSERFNNFKKTADFANYFLKSRSFEDNDKFYSMQKEFLNKCDILGGNADAFNKAFKSLVDESASAQRKKYCILTDIIQNWDIKELCEIPDSVAIRNLVDIFYEGKQKFKKVVPDTVFVQNVITPTWTGGQVVQNGWQKEFYEMIKCMRTPNIKSTVTDIISWVDSKVSVDSNFVFYYYSCPLNPIEIINMNSIPDYYRLKLIDSALKILGIPTRWKGQLEYYNGKKFVVLEKEDSKKEETIKEKKLRLSLYADGKKLKAEPWNNFLMSEFGDGELNYYYFDGKNDSLDYIITYPVNKEKNLYLQAAVRNTNGDANVSIKTLNQDEDSLRIDLITPKEYIDISTELREDDINIVRNYISELSMKGNKILMIRGVISNEPTQRMTSLLTDKAKEYKDNDT
ncbi:MAG: transglutaminase-like domain-containing protein, partial [Candidatus Delongbacteria bacterium]|nr:transglutaminase-like domain-containing protein [Candidatus Delongbacteria bacterium]